jgi:anti-sigma B factor antagonist
LVLRIDQRSDGDRHTLVLTGELDMATAPELEQHAQRVCSERANELVLDLTRLDFVDSAGLNALLRVRATCEDSRCDFLLTPGTRPVQRLFEVTRVIDRLPFRGHGKRERQPSEQPEASPELHGAEPGDG